MMRPSVSSVLVGFLGATVVAQEARPAFEVASVRKQAAVVRSEPSAVPTPTTSTTYRTRNATVASFIVFAYGVIAAQVVGGPSWVHEDFFEIDARPGREASRDEMRLMVRSLLEDRFKLVIHREQRQLRTSTIVLARQDGLDSRSRQEAVHSLIINAYGMLPTRSLAAPIGWM
jgi:uncharacterized protein (TIGR03435 family)